MGENEKIDKEREEILRKQKDDEVRQMISDKGYCSIKTAPPETVKKVYDDPQGFLHDLQEDSMEFSNTELRFFLCKTIDSVNTFLIQYYEEDGLGNTKVPCIEVIAVFMHRKKRK